MRWNEVGRGGSSGSGGMVYHCHALGVGVVAEADHDEARFFGEDRLVDVPGGVEVVEEDGAHCCGVCVKIG